MFGTISFGLMFSVMVNLFQDVFSRHPVSRVGDLMYASWWIVDGASSLVVMWAAWWCFLRNPAAARALQWGCIGLLVAWCFLLVVGLVGQRTGLLWISAKDDPLLFIHVFSFIRRTINDATIPGLLLSVALHPATRKLLGSSRGDEGSITPPSASDNAAAVASPLENEAGEFPLAAMAHVRFCAGIMAMAIGAVQPVKVIFFALLSHTAIPWTTASHWSSRPLAMAEELLRNAAGITLFAGGWAILKQHRFGRPLILFGSGATLLMLFQDTAIFGGSWNETYLRITFAVSTNLRVLTALVLLIGLFNCRAIRMNAAMENKGIESDAT